MRNLGGMFGAGQLELAPFTEGMETARAQLDGITQQLARAVTRDPVAALVGAQDVRKAWKGLGLDQQRTVLRALVEVTLKTPRQGRMPDGGYFDYDAVVFTWKRGRLDEGYASSKTSGSFLALMYVLQCPAGVKPRAVEYTRMNSRKPSSSLKESKSPRSIALITDESRPITLRASFNVMPERSLAAKKLLPNS